MHFFAAVTPPVTGPAALVASVLLGAIFGVLLHRGGVANYNVIVNYHIKAANMLGVVLGAAIFGVGMVLYGYCPGTAIAAAASGSIHGLVGLAGLLVGGTLYAFSFPWIAKNILPVAALGKVRLPDVTGVPALVWFVALLTIALTVFFFIERAERRAPASVSS
jgi:uncharacterized membrane protein YedE/YeeE